MLIEELTREESLDLLARARIGRLACAQRNQPYLVPVNFVYDDNYLYSFSTVGQKIDWMRANPLVCVEIDEIVSTRQWATVIIFGSYEELPDTYESRSARAYALQLLQRNPIWWEPAYTKTNLQGAQRPLEPLYFRIRVHRIEGHRATRETLEQGDTKKSTPESNDETWFRRILRQVRG